jgi:hypothetical protein
MNKTRLSVRGQERALYVEIALQAPYFRIQVDKPRDYLVLKRPIFPVIGAFGKEHLI